MAWSPENQAKAFLAAASMTRLARVRELLALGVDANAADPWGRTALQLAVRYAYHDETEALEIVRTLLVAGADINAADGEGFTALKHAAIYGRPEILRHLISVGAEVNHRDSQGHTAISLIESTPALVKRRRRIVKILEQAGGVR
jgi:ankyrin repeat protein